MGAGLAECLCGVIGACGLFILYLGQTKEGMALLPPKTLFHLDSPAFLARITTADGVIALRDRSGRSVKLSDNALRGTQETVGTHIAQLLKHDATVEVSINRRAGIAQLCGMETGEEHWLLTEPSSIATESTDRNADGHTMLATPIGLTRVSLKKDDPLQCIAEFLSVYARTDIRLSFVLTGSRVFVSTGSHYWSFPADIAGFCAQYGLPSLAPSRVFICGRIWGNHILFYDHRDQLGVYAFTLRLPVPVSALHRMSAAQKIRWKTDTMQLRFSPYVDQKIASYVRKALVNIYESSEFHRIMVALHKNSSSLGPL